MRPRHRSPGNGYRFGSLSTRIGLPSSRISPEGSVRNNAGIYGSEYRSFNRHTSFGRHGKSFQPSQLPPPSSGIGGFVDDIFMEAGRLAAEYLVSKGLLPPSALSLERKNDSLKMEHGEFHESKLLEGRSSALASRIGNTGSDPGSSRRRLPDELSPSDLRNQVKGRRKEESFRAYESNRGDREYGRSASSLDMGANDGADAVSGYKNQCEVGSDVGEELQKSIPTELSGERENNSESELTKNPLCVDMGLKTTCSDTIPQENDVQFNNISGNVKILTSGMEDVKKNSASDVTIEQSAIEKQSEQTNILVNDPLVEPQNDLLALSRFAKVPTKTRSALSYKGSKIVHGAVLVQKKLSENSFRRDPENSIDIKSSEGFVSDARSGETDELKHLSSEVANPVLMKKGIEECGSLQTLVVGGCLAENEQQSVDKGTLFGRNSYMYKYRGQKRAPEESNAGKETKKAREILSPMAANEDSTFHLPDLSERKHNSEESEKHDKEHIMDFEFPKDGVERCVEYRQEKQFFPSTFKICDLNLMEASNVQENHGSDPIIFFPSVSQTKMEGPPVDIDLSMNNSSETRRDVKQIYKEIEIIDLENDSVHEDEAFNIAERNLDLDTFPNHAQDRNDAPPDVQDGFGLMISELLGADFPSCSSVSGDINSIDNEMVLHNEQGPLGDDDSIYMSLGEIPLTFLRAWEQQPTQEFEKPF